MILPDKKLIFIHVPKCAGMSMRKVLTMEHHLPSKNLHAPARDLCCEGYFSFGFVRNPWDRMWSYFQMACGWQPRPDWAFRRFISVRCIPQLAYLRDQNDHLVNFIGRFERLHEDWAIIAERFDLLQPLPHENQGVGTTSYRDGYTDDMRKLIGQICAEEIEMFGYTF